MWRIFVYIDSIGRRFQKMAPEIQGADASDAQCIITTPTNRMHRDMGVLVHRKLAQWAVRGGSPLRG